MGLRSKLMGQVVLAPAGSGAGGIPTGHVRDVSGTYRPALFGGIAVFLLGAMPGWFHGFAFFEP